MVLDRLLLTVVTASMDEIHQTFLPFRTGRWQDVVLDTSGAFALQLMIYLACQWHFEACAGRDFLPRENYRSHRSATRAANSLHGCEDWGALLRAPEFAESGTGR